VVNNHDQRLVELIRDTLRGKEAMQENVLAGELNYSDNRYPSCAFQPIEIVRRTRQECQKLLGAEGVHTCDGYFFEDAYVEKKLQELINEVKEVGINMGKAVELLGGGDGVPAVCNLIAQQRVDELKEGGVVVITSWLGKGFAPDPTPCNG
jgi:hypothetical protein